MPTYAIEGRWTGPKSPAGDWDPFAHREFVRVDTKRAQDFLDQVRRMDAIDFTDGTALILDVRDVSGVHWTKRGKKRNGYGWLIRQCAKHGVTRVADLPKGR